MAKPDDPSPNSSEEPFDEARHAELVDKHVYGDPGRRREHGKAAWFKHTSSASVGIEIAVAISGCTLLAMWLENNYTHWSPWTTMLGFAVGMGAAVKAVVRTIREYEQEVARRETLAAKDEGGGDGEGGEDAELAAEEPAETKDREQSL